ncbi:MAG: DUF3300 domain-containing protein [Candidatus Eremiobacteraeota bacterium]|nr:DUF3300 domain-containing protein [Candidatus Eremiobacteraeota bacterium]MCW5865894.1 DUF3300 domain-containing protein [Candidatus Eremiobacteraeota bacterium]
MRFIRLASAVWLILLACLSPAGWAQNNYSASDLDTLVAPVALYPDPLLSNVLSASTQPQQVKAANQALQSGQKITQGKTGWDSSVEALTTYPTVLSMMAGNDQWTQSLGYAVSNQITDVADAVQRVRYQARQAGNLDSDGQVNVIEEGTNIRIESANPQVIYVPTYDTASLYQPGMVLRYSAAIATNVLLWQNVFNWNDACFYRPPYGWVPPASYYRPYGWRTAGYYNPANVYRPYGNNLYQRNVNNINTNINVSSNNLNRVNNNLTRNNWSNRNNTFNNRPAMPTQMPASVNTGTRFQMGSAPSFGNYTSAGSASRDSFRGAQSRGFGSFGNGMRSGGGRRR